MAASTTGCSVQPVSRIDFILVPDKNSARRLRRLFSGSNGRTGVLVGTWPELVDHALKAYLLSSPASEWSEHLKDTATSMKDAFWAMSLDVAPDETSSVLDQALTLLLEAVGPAGRLHIPPTGVLSQRAARNLSDLERLHTAMGAFLPPSIAPVAALLAAPGERAVRRIAVYLDKEWLYLNEWQVELVRKLTADAGSMDPSIEEFCASALAPLLGAQTGALKMLQENLFRQGAKGSIDNTVQWLGVRDFLEEVEVAVGMMQEALRNDPTLAPRDFGVLLPADSLYVDGLKDVAAHAGLQLSGLPERHEVRDFGRENVYLFLQTRQVPPPAMALAALLSSPLMPWSVETGLDLAQTVMDGNLNLEAPTDFTPRQRKMLSLIRNTSGNEASAEALSTFVGLLQAPDGMELHLSRGIAAVAGAQAILERGGDSAFHDCLAAVTPEQIYVAASQSVTREGVSVFLEGEEPWRQVRRLLVLGFSEGRYPRVPSGAPIFSDSDLLALREKGGYRIQSPQEKGARLRTLFLNQIKCASDRVDFFIPRRDCAGKGLRPSQTLTYMAQLFDVGDPEKLVLELEREGDRMRAIGLAVAPTAVPVQLRALEKKDLFLKRDLLCLHRYEDGSPKPQSPSSLETLMVSPLAWLLGRAGLEPREWAPESLDVATKGTLAHYVFEHLFKPGETLPDNDEIKQHIHSLLADGIRKKKPFLQGGEWRVERKHLERDVEMAALAWRGLLEEMGATVLGNEVWLRGRLDTLPIHGSADLLLGLPGGRMYVVDYKKAGSRPRRERMTKGYDSQASLYRLMLENGSREEMSDILKSALEGPTDIGVAYFMMNDQVALTDTNGWIKKGTVGVEELGSGISDSAMELIRRRIAELRGGSLKLNHEGDPEWYKGNSGITMYALENSPLLSLFMKQDEASAEDERADGREVK